MDILTHTLSGVAIGTVVASFSKKGLKNRLKIILLSGIAGALPDLDAISLWSGFDSTIGEFFNLSNSGKEIYSSKLWYSHHACLHSLFAGFIIALSIGGVRFMIGSKFCNLKFRNFINSIKNNQLLLIGFFFGFVIHLLEDMPTPSSSWGGVALFWPSELYIGGTGDIWWWNNYDLFLIVVSVLILNITLHLTHKVVRLDLRKYTTGLFLVGLTLVLIQIKSRDCDFSYSGNTNRYQEFENRSKEIQKDILGDDLFYLMERFDNKLKIHF